MATGPQPHNEVVIAPKREGDTMKKSIVGIVLLNVSADMVDDFLKMTRIRETVNLISPGLPIFVYSPRDSAMTFLNMGGRRKRSKPLSR